MIYHYCILESTPEIFAAWLQRTVTGGRFHVDESPAVMILTYLPEVIGGDDNGLLLTIGGVRLDIETGESTPLEVASFTVSALSASRVVVHMAFGDFTSGLVAYFSSVLKVIGELWPESGLAQVGESSTPAMISDAVSTPAGDQGGETTDEKRLRGLWSDESLSYPDIGAKLGFSESWVSRHRKKLGLPPRPQGRKPGH